MRSNKVSKRHKHSSACDEIKEGKDIISKLPDALLTIILSFLPKADAIRTCILSSRWKYIWVFLPNLRLIMPFCRSIEAKKFHDSVDRILAVRGNTPCKTFYLYCSKNCDYNRVYDWLCTILKCKVEEIELWFPADRFRVKFPWDLFMTSNTLVELTLRGEFVLDVPESESLFPCLKKLNLLSIIYVGDQTITNLISACPLIEELFVERQVIRHSDNIRMFKVSSSSLKRLSISFALCVPGEYCQVAIDAPNLEYMYIVDVISRRFTFTKPLFLVEAYISSRPLIDTESLLSNLSSVKTLTVADSTLMPLHFPDNLDMPIFHNLVKFVIGLEARIGWRFLSRLINSMPNLEDITFLDGLVPFPRAQHIFNMQWNPPLEVPHCLQYKMKEITILNQEAITQEELPLITYLLKHSHRLETFRINAHKINLTIYVQLSSSPRGSAFCRIELV